MKITRGETQIFQFPLFDFQGMPPGYLGPTQATINGNVGTAIGGPLRLGKEGWWKVWGIMGSRCFSSSGGLTNGVNLNIQISEVGTENFWFNMTSDTGGGNIGQGAPNLGAAIEAVAGKWGNPRKLNSPRILPPGTELILEAMHYEAFTPTGRSPLYVALMCQLVDGPDDVYSPTIQGEPSYLPQVFNFDPQSGGVPLDLNQNRTIETQLGSPHDYLIDSLQSRYPLNADVTNFLNSFDPRRSELEIMIQARASSTERNFYGPAPVLLCLVSGQFGARNFYMPSFFRLKSGQSLITEITNYSLTDLENKLELTFTGLLEGKK